VTESNASLAHRPRIIFVCSGNTCRSVLAEFIARLRFGTLAEFESAGVSPGTIADTENAIYTLKDRFNIDVSHIPRNVLNVDLKAFDMIVTMSNAIAIELQRQRARSHRRPDYSRPASESGRSHRDSVGDQASSRIGRSTLVDCAGRFQCLHLAWL
jgi:protein-tyrosine-phosphatase